MNTARANPFADLSDFEPKPPSSTAAVLPAALERVAEDNGFPSRQAKRSPKAAQEIPHRRPGRRYTTGRNQQINIKATAAVIERLYQIADSRHVPLGQVLEMALEALERQEGEGRRQRSPSDPPERAKGPPMARKGAFRMEGGSGFRTPRLPGSR
jgi:hypothetical protein